MKHVKSVTKTTAPARASVAEWLVNYKNGFVPGVIITEGKPWYVDALWFSDDSLDPENEDLPLYVL
jgi:hypothetical protein